MVCAASGDISYWVLVLGHREYSDGYPRPAGTHTVVRVRHGTDSGRTRRAGSANPSSVVALLTVGWLLAVVVLTWMWFGLGMEGWAYQHSNSGQLSAELAARIARVSLWLAGIGAGGPALIAVVAYFGGMVRTSVVYLMLAMVLVVPAYRIAGPAYRTLNPPGPPPPAPTHCVEYSGGDTKCPGG